MHVKEGQATTPGIHPLLFMNSAVLITEQEKLLGGFNGLSSLSEKTWKSNHFEMKLQRQHFLLSYC